MDLEGNNKYEKYKREIEEGVCERLTPQLMQVKDAIRQGQLEHQHNLEKMLHKLELKIENNLWSKHHLYVLYLITTLSILISIFK